MVAVDPPPTHSALATPEVRRREQQVLRALLASLESAASVSVAPDVSDQLILKVARHHRVSPLIAALAPPGLSASLAEEMRRDRIATLARTTLLRHALREALQALTAAGVDVVVLKGVAYEELAYPAPGTRPATDIDLLVLPMGRARAFEALGALGYAPVSGAPGYDEPDYHEVTLRRDDVNIDLHIGLAPFVRGKIDYAELWDATRPLTIEGVKTRTLGAAHLLVNHALHMAIHHFDVPALYLVDLARLTIDADTAAAAAATARSWRCERPWQTAVALTSAFLPASQERLGRDRTMPPYANRVVRSYGSIAALPRPEQLLRKVTHFDRPMDAILYLTVQSRRIARERVLGWVSRRTPVERLGWNSGSRRRRVDRPDWP